MVDVVSVFRALFHRVSAQLWSRHRRRDTRDSQTVLFQSECGLCRRARSGGLLWIHAGTAARKATGISGTVIVCPSIRDHVFRSGYTVRSIRYNQLSDSRAVPAITCTVYFCYNRYGVYLIGSYGFWSLLLYLIKMTLVGADKSSMLDDCDGLKTAGGRNGDVVQLRQF